MYVYFDQDGDGEADEIDYTYDSETGEITIDADSWVYETKEFDLNDNGVIDAGEEAVTYEVICKSLIYKVYELIASDPTSHTDTLSSLVTEIQNASKASYSQSITSADNTWAKYKKLGLNVKTEDVTVTWSLTKESKYAKIEDGKLVLTPGKNVAKVGVIATYTNGAFSTEVLYYINLEAAKAN